VKPSEKSQRRGRRGPEMGSNTPFQFVWPRIPARFTPGAVLETNFQTISRDCLKSSGRTSGVALRAAKEKRFSPFRLPYTGQIHTRSIARTPFRKDSEGVFSDVRRQESSRKTVHLGNAQSHLGV
jgi:hypothetical protein